MPTQKIMSKLTDTQVKDQLAEWRRFGYLAAYTYSYRMTQYNLTAAQEKTNKKLVRSMKQLYLNPYKNQRLELKRWRDLYKALAPSLKDIRVFACERGQRYLDQVQVLYSGKPIKTTVVLTVEVDVTYTAGDNPNYAANYNVTVASNQESIKVKGKPRVTRRSSW